MRIIIKTLFLLVTLFIFQSCLLNRLASNNTSYNYDNPSRNFGRDKPYFTYEWSNFRFDIFKEYSRDFNGFISDFPSTTIKYYESDQLIYEGDPTFTITKIAEDIINDIAEIRTFTNIELFGIILNDAITNYPSFFPSGINNEEQRVIYTKDLSNSDWDIIKLSTDGKGIIKEIFFLKYFKKYDNLDHFYLISYDALQTEFVKQVSSNTLLQHLAIENPDNSTFFNTTKDDNVTLKGVDSKEELVKKYVPMLHHQLIRKSSPILFDEFDKIIAPGLNQISLVKSVSEGYVAFFVDADDIVINHAERDAAILLEGF